MAEFTPILLTLPSLAPTLAVEIVPYGLTVRRLFVQADGKTHDVIVGPEDAQHHVTTKYTNPVIGRYANRLPVGTHAIERNGIKGQFTALANETPLVSLHGGPVGFDSVPWTVVKPAEVQLFSKAEIRTISGISSDQATSHAVFRLISPDGDQGFSGRLLVEVLAALTAPAASSGPVLDMGSLVFIYRAKLVDTPSKAITPLNMTQHWGFNLEASLSDGLSIKDHVLTLQADKIAVLDANNLRTGYRSTSGDSVHSHKGKRIGDNFPASGYDHYYMFSGPRAHAQTRLSEAFLKSEANLVKPVLNGETGGARPGATAETPDAILSSGKSGITLKFTTNQEGVMFYSNNFASPASGSRKKIHGGSGVKDAGDAYGPGSAVFLEFHQPLAACLDPARKDGEDTLLTTGEVYNNWVRCNVRYTTPL
ncbi:galactose mutarotase-like protein [Fistulina hepatica ATCC 64428]|nr:galactose mutarotase-like protein [Fistulina hepatica ATCC 64428]